MERPDRPDAAAPDIDASGLAGVIIDRFFCTLDRCGIVTSWNRDAQRFTGYHAVDVIHQPVSILGEEQVLEADGCVTALPDDGSEIDAWQTRKDGSRFWARVSTDPIRDRAGALLGFTRMVRDLSASRPAGEAEQPFRLLVQNVIDHAIFLLDNKGLVRTWNTGAQRLEGYLPEEVIGQHFSMFFIEQDRTKGEPERNLEVAARTGLLQKDAWRVRKDGSIFLATVDITPIRNEGGGLIGFAIVTRDMTHARKSQLDLDRARDALFQSQKMEAVGQLTGGVAHDFNNILMAVLGGLEIIQRRLPEDPNITPLLNNAVHAARRGKSLTERMLAFARRQDLAPETVHLPTLVNGMRDFLQRSLGPSIAIEVEVPPDLKPVLVDPHQLELALLNLAMNARDALPDGGPVCINAREQTVADDEAAVVRPGRYICVSVRDYGDGMDEKTLSRAIEPFFTTKGLNKGTGLGLSMVHGFAEQSGGQFILKSRKNHGTMAEIWIPLASRANIGDEAAEMTEAVPDGHPLVVLVVDDDRLMLMHTTLLLNNLGHRVFAATSGEQALDIIRRETVIDLVIVDHAMPGMSGAETLEAIKSEWPNLPVIFATPLADPSVQRMAKPLRAEDLARAIARANTTRHVGTH